MALYEYLTSDNSKFRRYIRGAAGSILEIALLNSPCLSSANYVYYHHRKESVSVLAKRYQSEDYLFEFVDVLKKSSNSLLEDEPLYQHFTEKCNFDQRIGTKVKTNINVHMIPYIYHEPSSYNDIRKYNQLFYLLNRDVDSTVPIRFEVKTNSDLIIICNSAFNYVLLTKLIVGLSPNDPPPSRIIISGFKDPITYEEFLTPHKNLNSSIDGQSDKDNNPIVFCSLFSLDRNLHEQTFDVKQKSFGSPLPYHILIHFYYLLLLIVLYK